MFVNAKVCILSLIIVATAHHSTALADISERVEISGFGRIIGGYLSTDSAKYEKYTNSIDFSQQSLLAVQGDVRITDHLSLSGQLLAHASSQRESGVEWLYLNYEPSANWRFKIGKLRTPFFRYSDVLDVGFTYPWISAPQQVYSGFLFSNYEKSLNIIIDRYLEYIHSIY